MPHCLALIPDLVEVSAINLRESFHLRLEKSGSPPESVNRCSKYAALVRHVSPLLLHGYRGGMALVCLFVTTLLIHNSHTIKFTTLKYTVQWSLVCWLSCATIITV